MYVLSGVCCVDLYTSWHLNVRGYGTGAHFTFERTVASRKTPNNNKIRNFYAFHMVNQFCSVSNQTFNPDVTFHSHSKENKPALGTFSSITTYWHRGHCSITNKKDSCLHLQNTELQLTNWILIPVVRPVCWWHWRSSTHQTQQRCWSSFTCISICVEF